MEYRAVSVMRLSCRSLDFVAITWTLVFFCCNRPPSFTARSSDMSVTLPPLPTNIAAKTGPRLLGYLFHWGLFGILTTQVYMYYIAFPNDSLKSKVLVYTVYALEIAQTVMSTMTAFHVFATGYGDFDAYNDIWIVWFSVPLMSGIVAFLAEAFYAYRVRILSGSLVVSGVIFLLALFQLAGSIASAVVVKEAVLFSRLLGPRFYITSAVWNGGSALCDVVIALCMTYYLSRRRSQGLKSTQATIKRLIVLVIETGTVTAVFAILTLILTVLPGHPSYYQVPSAILAKVYSNSMMVVLNSRMYISGNGEKPRGTLSTLHIQDALAQGGTRPTEMYELGGDHGANVSTDEVLFAKMDNTKLVRALTSTVGTGIRSHTTRTDSSTSTQV